MRDREKVLAVVREWVVKAENDLKNATHTIKLGQRSPTDTAADGHDDEKVYIAVRSTSSSVTLDQCDAFDCDGNRQVTVDCLVRAVENRLNGCGG